MTSSDHRFLRQVYRKAEQLKLRRKRAALLSLCGVSVVAIGCVCALAPNNMLLYTLAGGTLLSLLSAAEWLDLRQVRGEQQYEH